MADKNDEEWQEVAVRRKKANERDNQAMPRDKGPAQSRPGRGGQRGGPQGRGQSEGFVNRPTQDRAPVSRGRASSADYGSGRGRKPGLHQSVISYAAKPGNVHSTGDMNQDSSNKKHDLRSFDSSSRPERGAGDAGRRSVNDHERSASHDKLETNTSVENPENVQKTAKDIAAGVGLEKRLQSDEYKSWVKDALCLQLFKEGVETFADTKSKELHQNMLQVLKEMGNPSVKKMCCSEAKINYDSDEIHCESCKTGKTNVRLEELKGICEKNTNVDYENHVIYCSCSNCTDYITVLNDYRVGEFTFTIDNFENSNIFKWHKEPWQLAKMFMNSGQDQQTIHPSGTDFSGIVNFITHCSVPRDSLRNKQLPDVRDIRNDIFHTSCMEVQKKDFKSHTADMIKFLKCIPGTSDTIDNIHLVRRADFTITLRHENDVLAELKNEIRKTIEEHERQIQDLQTGKVSRDEFKEVMRSIEAKNVEMEKTLKCLTEKTDATDYDLRVEVRRLHVALEETKAMFQAAQEHWIHRFDELKWEVSEMKEENQKSEMLVDEADCQRFQRSMVGEYKHDFCQMNRSPIYDCVNENVPKIPFEEFYSDIDIELCNGNKNQSFYDILGDKNCQSILIKGEFGIGKSSLCRRMALAWCKAHEKPRDGGGVDKSITEMEGSLYRFQYLFIVSQDKCEGENESILDAIYSSLGRLSDRRKMVNHILKEHSESVLIIIDGFGERQNTVIEGINRSTILMTTDVLNYDAICSSEYPKIDSVFTLNGLSEEGIKNLQYKVIESYYKSSGDEYISSMSKECMDSLNSLDLSKSIENPFILKMLVVNWVDGKISPSMTCNALEMLKCFDLRAQNKAKIKTGKSMGTVSSSSTERKSNDETIPGSLRDKVLLRHSDLLLKLGKYAYKGLTDTSKSFSHPFTECEFDEQLKEDLEMSSKNLRVVTKHTHTPENDEKQITLSFLHHHFEQFFMALWIVSKQCENSEWLSCKEDFSARGRIIQFVCGLNSTLGSKLSRHMIKIVSEDLELLKFRLERTAADSDRVRGKSEHQESVLDTFKRKSFAKLIEDAEQCLQKLTDLILHCMTEVEHSYMPDKDLVIADVVQSKSIVTEQLIKLIMLSKEHLQTLLLYECSMVSFQSLQRLTKAVRASSFLKALAIELKPEEDTQETVSFDLSNLSNLRTFDIFFPNQYNCNITLGKGCNFESFRCTGIKMPRLQWTKVFQCLGQSPKLSLLCVKNASTNEDTVSTYEDNVGTTEDNARDAEENSSTNEENASTNEDNDRDHPPAAEDEVMGTGKSDTSKEFQLHMVAVKVPSLVWGTLFQFPHMERLTLLELKDVEIDYVKLKKCKRLAVLWMSNVQCKEIRLPSENMLGEISVKSTPLDPSLWSEIFSSLSSSMQRLQLEDIEVKTATLSEEVCSKIKSVHLKDVTMDKVSFLKLELSLSGKPHCEFEASQTGQIVNLKFKV